LPLLKFQPSYVSGFSARKTGFNPWIVHVELDNFHSNFFDVSPAPFRQRSVFFHSSPGRRTDNEPIRSLSSTIFHITTTEGAKILYHSGNGNLS